MSFSFNIYTRVPEMTKKRRVLVARAQVYIHPRMYMHEQSCSSRSSGGELHSHGNE